MNKNLIIGLLLSSLLFVAPAFALDLGTAKARGLVGETLSGYLDSVTASPGSDVRNVIADINRRRKEEYQKIANSNGTPLSSVEALAGKKAVENTQSGHYVKTPDGRWLRK